MDAAVDEGDFVGDEAYFDTLVDKINEAGEDRDVYITNSKGVVDQ